MWVSKESGHNMLRLGHAYPETNLSLRLNRNSFTLLMFIQADRWWLLGLRFGNDYIQVQRGRCNVQGCDCTEYSPLSEGKMQAGNIHCRYCDHAPLEHLKIENQLQTQTGTVMGVQLNEAKQIQPKEMEPSPSLTLVQPDEAKRSVSPGSVWTKKAKSQGSSYLWCLSY